MNKYKDSTLANIFEELPVISLKTLLKPNSDELRALHKGLKSQSTPLPLLSFPKVNSFHLATAQKAATEVKQKMMNVNAHHILLRFYLEKLSEYECKLDLIEAVQKQDALAVGQLTQKLYGSVTVTQETYRNLLTNRVSKHKTSAVKKESITVNAENFAALARKKLDAIGGQDWIIKIMKRDRIQISYKRRGPPTLRIPTDLALTTKRAEQVLRHEIDGHAKRTINGLKSGYKILGQGLAYHKRAEEGVATHVQKTVNSGLWDGYTSTLRQEKNLQEAYNTLVQEKMRYYQSLGKKDAEHRARTSAWRLIKRTLLGVHNPTPAGAAFFRTHIYFEGKKEVREAIEQSAVTIDDLMIGNIGLQHVADVKKLLASK